MTWQTQINLCFDAIFGYLFCNLTSMVCVSCHVLTLLVLLSQGGDLFDAIVHCHHFTEATCKRIVRDLGHALLYLHGKKIVHRDIKPENLFVSGDSHFCIP